MTDTSLTAGLLRSKGFCWIVNRPRWAAVWSQAGRVMELTPRGVWWADSPRDDWPTDPAERVEILTTFEGVYSDRRQELVFIGRNLDERAIRASLDVALMSDIETGDGPAVWDTIDDPFPPWPVPTAGDAETPAHTIATSISEDVR